jgi:transposase-like protein
MLKTEGMVYARDLNSQGFNISEISRQTGYDRKTWRRIKTTNMVERLNKEVKRRAEVVGAFPSDESLMRL